MENVVDFLKGFGLGILAGIGTTVFIVVVLLATFTLEIGLAAALVCLVAYLIVLVRVFRSGRTWFGFGLLVALLLVVPAITTACFPNVSGPVPL